MKLWTDGRTDGRRTTEPSHPISSPGAFGSGELKTVEFANTVDPDEAAHNEQPHLDIQCFSLLFLSSHYDFSLDETCLQSCRRKICCLLLWRC